MHVGIFIWTYCAKNVVYYPSPQYNANKVVFSLLFGLKLVMCACILPRPGDLENGGTCLRRNRRIYPYRACSCYVQIHILDCYQVHSNITCNILCACYGWLDFFPCKCKSLKQFKAKNKFLVIRRLQNRCGDVLFYYLFYIFVCQELKDVIHRNAVIGTRLNFLYTKYGG